MELLRDEYRTLLDWKKNNNGKALLIYGVRQCGKTWLVRKFAKEEYESFIELNFALHSEQKKIFEGDLDSATILLNIQARYPQTRIIEKKTLLFLDEIEECPNAITALKPLAEDQRIDVIASGSMLGITYNETVLYPVGYLKTIRMHPLSFWEFAIASGISKDVHDYVKDCFFTLKPVSEIIHKSLLQLFRKYVLLGGMPKAITTYLDSGDWAKVNEELDEIHLGYSHDVIKYAKKDKDKILAVYRAIPSMLASGGTRFMLSYIDKNARYNRYESGFNWLFDSGTVLPCYNVSAPVSSLEINSIRNLQKLYLSDVGLLSSRTLLGNRFDLLNDEYNINLGFIYENAIAEELSSQNHSLYYYNSKKIGEIDFLLQVGLDVIPIEVKSGKNYLSHKALDNLIANYNYKRAFVISSSNLENEGKIVNIPWYMANLIGQDLLL